MQPDDALNDAALDRELRRALAVDPSPEFVTRVRMRVNDEPAPGWRFSWMVASGALAVSAIVFAIVASRGGGPVAYAPVVTPDASSSAARSSEERLPVLPIKRAQDRRHADAAPLTAALLASAFSRTVQPEILIDRREAEAIRTFLDGIHDGRIDATPLLRDAPAQDTDAEPTPDIYITPIEVEPLTTVHDTRGVPQ